MSSLAARVLALAVVAVAAIVLVLSSSRSGDVPQESEVSVSDPEDRSPAEPEPEDPIALVGDPDASADRTELSPAVSTDVADGRCVVTGIVLGPDGGPHEGARCRIAAKKRWSRDADSEAFDAFGVDRSDGWVGYETLTDATGRFLLDVPVPSARRVELFVEAGPYLSVASLAFGKGRGRLDPLEGGLREIDDIHLEARGAASGVVGTNAGTVVPGAIVRLTPADDAGDEIRIVADEDGAFRRGHVPPGEWTARAGAEEMLDSEPVAFVVTAGAERSGLRLELSSAPIVTGRVVTPDLEPVEGATVRAASAPGAPRRTSAQAQSDAEGAFELVLPARSEFDVSCQHREYRPASGPLRLAGANDGVTLVLKPLARVHVRAVDARSGEVLERFGVIKVADGGSKAANPEYARRTAPRAKKVREGYVEVFGRAGRDLLIVAADGYAACYADLAGATWSDGITRPKASPTIAAAPGAEVIVQTIEMRPGGTILGRALLDGEPTAATVTVGPAPDADNLFVVLRGRQLQRTADTDAATGAFSIDGLPAGRYGVTVRGGDGRSVTVPAVEVPVDGEADLGDLELLPAGTIVGQVQLPPDVDPNGLFVEVVDLTDVPKGPVTEDATFRLEGVPAGVRTIRQGALRRDFIMGGDTEVVVPPGGEVQVTLDLTSFRVVPVTLQIELDGAPVSGVEVRLVDEEFWPRRRIPDLTEEVEAYVGRTDATGRLSAYGRAQGRRIPVLHIDGWSVIAHPTARLDFGLGVPIDERVEFRSASAKLGFPADFEFPKDGSLRIELVSTDDARVRSTVTIGFEDGDVDEAFGARVDVEDRTVSLERLAPGDWRITATLFAERIAPARVGHEPDAAIGASKEGQRVFEATATLASGEARADVSLVARD